jgi:hypothetical protein
VGDPDLGRRVAGLLRELYAATVVDPDDPGVTDTSSITRYRFLPPGDGEPGVVARDDEILVSSAQPSTLLGRLVWAINQQVINGSADRLLLHAGAVEVDGVGVLIPAAMEAGKTTLVTGLLDRGASYLTDEAASVTPDLVLEGYAKPLSIDRGSWEVLAHHAPDLDAELAPYLETQWQVPPHRAAPVVARSQLGLMVFRRYEAGTPTRMERVSPATAVRLAVGCTFVTDREHLSLERLRELASIAERVPAYELVGGDLDEACEAVRAVVRDVAASVDRAAVDDPGGQGRSLVATHGGC